MIELTVKLVIDADSIRDAEKLFESWLGSDDDDRLVEYEIVEEA